MTGCAPAKRPPFAEGGVENAVRISGSGLGFFCRCNCRSAAAHTDCALWAGSAFATAFGSRFAGAA